MTLQEMREKRAQLVEDMEGVLSTAEQDGRLELDEDESALYAEYEAELERVTSAMERRQTLEGHKASMSTPEPSKLHAQGAGRAAPPAPEAPREFESLGDFVGAVTRHYMGKGDDPRLEWSDPTPGAADQAMESGASGGFLVPSQFRDTLLSVDPQAAVIESRSNVMAAGTPPDAAVTVPALDQTGDTPDNVYGGVSVEWIGEADPKPETNASFREIELQPHEVSGHVPMTDKLMRNAPAMTQQVETLMRGALTAARERAYLLGDGVAKPLGIINAGAAYAVNRGVSTEVAYTDIDAMVARLMMDGPAYWLITQEAYTQISRIQDPNGNYVWQPNAVEGSPGSLFGYPVFWHSRSPALGVRGDVTLVNSNPYYMIKPGSGPFVAMGYANDDFTRNRTRIKVFHNIDAKPWLTEPFTQENGHQVSPFVTLDVPA